MKHCNEENWSGRKIASVLLRNGKKTKEFLASNVSRCCRCCCCCSSTHLFIASIYSFHVFIQVTSRRTHTFHAAVGASVWGRACSKKPKYECNNNLNTLACTKIKLNNFQMIYNSAFSAFVVSIYDMVTVAV